MKRYLSAWKAYREFLAPYTPFVLLGTRWVFWWSFLQHARTPLSGSLLTQRAKRLRWWRSLWFTVLIYLYGLGTGLALIWGIPTLLKWNGPKAFVLALFVASFFWTGGPWLVKRVLRQWRQYKGAPTTHEERLKCLWEALEKSGTYSQDMHDLFENMTLAGEWGRLEVEVAMLGYEGPPLEHARVLLQAHQLQGATLRTDPTKPSTLKRRL